MECKGSSFQNIACAKGMDNAAKPSLKLLCPNGKAHVSLALSITFSIFAKE